MRTSLIEFPWLRHGPGESFFVVGVDVTAIQAAGLQAASQQLGLGAKVKAAIGIHQGYLGVLFTVLPR